MTNPPPPPTYDAIENMARAYMQSRTVLTAIELDVFTAVGADGGSAGDIAATLGTDVRATEMLLNALVALELLEKNEGRFTCGAVPAEHLSAGSPKDSRSIFRHLAQIWTSWSALTECVRTGGPAEGRAEKPRDESWTKSFIGAMHEFALTQAEAFVDAVDLTGVGKVLDLGGGSGAYAITFARKSADVKSTVFDLPSVIPLTRDCVAEAGLTGRVDSIEGDMCKDDFGTGYDLVWISSVCHMLGPEENVALFGKVHAALEAGGRVAVRDFLMESDKTSPLFGAIFALNMLVSTQNGSSWSRAEYSDWLQEAGFAEPELVEVAGAGNAAILVARKTEAG